MQYLNYFRPCRGAAHRCVHGFGEKAHLVYFAAVMVEGHGVYAMSAGACLALGLAAALIGEPLE